MPLASAALPTHARASDRLVGEALHVCPGHARAQLATVHEMAVDDAGLVHGSFAFGLADFAAMLAVGDPHVVLGSAQARFLAPVAVGAVMIAEAKTKQRRGRKHVVEVTVRVDDKPVFSGVFDCFVLDHHVLAPPPRP